MAAKVRMLCEKAKKILMGESNVQVLGNECFLIKPIGGLSNTMSKNFKSKSDNFGKMQMSCDSEGNIILIYFSKQFTYLHFSALCVQEVSSVSEDLEMYVLISSGTKYKLHFE
ncbi:unnamed protein product [Malus baccata var. baccata]